MLKIISKIKKVRNLASNNCKKRKAFVVAIDDFRKDRLYIKRFNHLLKKYGLQQAPVSKRDKALSSAEYGDFIIFGINNNFDYTVIESEDEMNKYSSKFGRRFFCLVEDEEDIYEALDEYIDANYNVKEDDDFDVEIDITIEIENEKPKKKKERQNFLKPGLYNIVKIFANYVKVGSDLYEIYVDTRTGKEYVWIDYVKYEIKKDIFGRKYLK
ncbi:MAG: hypothetical protein ACOC3V_01785 [bacterium]